MEPKNGGLVQMIFLFNWVIFNFQMEAMLNFQGGFMGFTGSKRCKIRMVIQTGKMEPGKDASWTHRYQGNNGVFRGVVLDLVGRIGQVFSKVEVDPTNVTCFNQKTAKLVWNDILSR